MNRPTRPKPTVKPIGGVPIIGKTHTHNPDIRFELAGIQLHPPMKADQMYCMLLLALSSGQLATLKLMHAFKMGFGAYLAEDSNLGKQYDLVQIQTNAEGEMEVIVARPKADAPKPTLLQ